jgi:hypothetical protein
VPSIVQFEYLAHLLTIPLQVAGIPARFIFDTGIGVNLISHSLAEQVGCIPDGSQFTGRRMAGTEVTIPLGRLPSLQAGPHQWRDLPIGIFDLHAMAGLDGVEGFLSLTCFRDRPVTVDYGAGVVVFEDAASAEARAGDGATVPAEVRCDGWSTDLAVGIDLPSGRSITVEVDTGSDALILDSSLSGAAGVELTDPAVSSVKGTDETGNEFVRYFTALAGDICVTGAPELKVTAPNVMLQEIIYDGLIGDQFLRNFTTTYDLPNSRMIFSRTAV